MNQKKRNPFPIATGQSMKNRIYISSFLSSFGNWLTFLAIALITKEKFGAQHVALVFLVQTLPAILFARGISQLIPNHLLKNAYWKIQVLLALTTLVLVFNQSLLVIYVHLFVAAVLKSISNPLFNSIIGRMVEKESHREVFTRVGALQAGTLALAPALGAWIKISISGEFLFLIDALLILISIGFLKELFAQEIPEKVQNSDAFNWKGIFAGISKKPKDIPDQTQKILSIWFIFLAVGAILNAIEFSGFEKIQMTEKEIGLAIAAWGVGNLIAFLVKNPIGSRLILIGLYMFVLGIFVLSWDFRITIFAFAAAGLASSYLSGNLRAEIQASVPEHHNPLSIWAYANQITQGINLVAYASAGFLLNILGFYTFGGLMMFAASLMFIHAKRNELKS